MPFSLWTVSYVGEVALSPSSFQWVRSDDPLPTSVGGSSNSTPLSPLFLQPMPGASKAHVSFLPQVPRALFLVLISRGQLSSPETSTETLSQGAWVSADLSEV